MDEKTQAAYQLFEPKGRQAFLQWFFPVVKAIGITKLVAGRWRAWLLSQPAKNAEAVWPLLQKKSATTAGQKRLQDAGQASHTKPLPRKKRKRRMAAGRPMVFTNPDQPWVLYTVL
jgi:hypothetical protein